MANFRKTHVDKIIAELQAVEDVLDFDDNIDFLETLIEYIQNNNEEAKTEKAAFEEEMRADGLTPQ